MKVPANPIEKHGFYQELLDQCFVSRSERIGQYEGLKCFYLWGTDQDALPIMSKIYGHLDTLTSFLYSADSTRFNIEIGAGVPKSELLKVPSLKEHFTQLWRGSTTDVLFGEALLWSLVYNSMFIYPVWNRGKLQTYTIQPHQFGVLREDIVGVDRQEAMAFRYQITRSELDSNLTGHPQREAILAKLTASSEPLEDKIIPSAVQRIIASQVSPNMVGQALWWTNPQVFFTPKVAADLVTLEDLWLWDDDIQDYRRVTMTQGLTIFDRPNTFIPRKGDRPGELPFVQVCPNPHDGYFWGRSEIVHLLALQQAWAHRMGQIQRINDKVTDPPKAGLGISADWMEVAAALNDPGGGVLFPEVQSGAKIENMAPTIPESVWHEIDYEDRLFAEASGITPIMKGYGESGVRSRGQTDTMARLGSSRTKKRAMIIEDSLDRLATVMLRLQQQEDKTRLIYQVQGKDLEFLPAQFTADATVKVDAHSMSPVFVEDEKQLAFSLKEAGTIDEESVLEMTHPGNMQMLKERLKAMLLARQKAQQEEEMKERQAELRRVK